MADLIPLRTATLIKVKGQISKVKIILSCTYFVLINAAYFTYILIKHSHVVGPWVFAPRVGNDKLL